MANQDSSKGLWWLFPLVWFNSLFAAVWTQYTDYQSILTREQIDQEVPLTPIPVTISIVVLSFLLVPIVALLIKGLRRYRIENAPGKIWTFESSLFWLVIAVPSWVLLLCSTHIGGQFWGGLFRPDWISYGWLATTIEIVVVMAAIKLFKTASNAYTAKMKQ